MRTTATIIAIALTLGACATESPSPQPPEPTEPPSEPVQAVQDEPVLTITAQGIGPVVAGMTLEEAGQTLAVDLPSSDSECDFVAIPNAPAGVAMMVLSGTVVRIDVRDTRDVRTAAGAGIGDSEARIQALYGGAVEIRPHKYTAGKYLIVPDSANSEFRLVFETNEQGEVMEYRSGLLPAVEWVEGCA